MASNTSSQPSASTILPYTHGLTGVNVSLDDDITRWLWFSLVALSAVVLLVRLGQRSNAHLRHLLNLHAGRFEQSYWSHDQTSWWPKIKRSVLYAPLHKKRHNREMQLSQAINVGTLPSRLHTLLLGLYLLSNIAFCSILKYGEKDRAAIIAEVRGRTGHLAVVNLIPLIIFAGRNNPLIALLHVSFDTYNLFHRWIGRIVVVQAVTHTLAWAANEHAARGFRGIKEAFAESAFMQYGLLATSAMLVILIQSPSVIRHAFYETFLHIHQLLAFAATLGVYVHAKDGKLPQKNYIIWVIALWASERCLRWLRIIFRNVSRQGVTKVTVEALPGEACRVTFDVPRPWRFAPGCHVYVYLPGVSLWMSHPFSIAWCDERPTPYLSLEGEKLPSSSSELELPSSSRTTTSYSLVMGRRSGMTARLYNKARASPTGIISLHGAVEGPYGGLESLHSYGTVLLFAGGVGITHQISHVRDLLAGFADGTVATRKVILVWSVRTTEQLEWVRPWMDSILGMPHRRDVVKILLFVTKPKSAREVVSSSATVQMFPGRANAAVLVDKEFRERVGAMAVTVCGPGGFADDVRAAVRRRIGEGTVDFVEEAFTW